MIIVPAIRKIRIDSTDRRKIYLLFIKEDKMQAANISISYYNYELSYQKVNSYREENELQENSSNKDNGYKV